MRPDERSGDPPHAGRQPQEVLADLPQGALRFDDLCSAVARHAPGLPVKDYGRISDD